MSEAMELHELIDRHLRGELSESEKERLAQLLDSDPAARRGLVEEVQWDTELAEVLRDGRGSAREANRDGGNDAAFVKRTAAIRGRMPARALAVSLLAIAALIIVLLTASLYSRYPSTDGPIATITGLSGSLQWTGDGGQVFDNLKLGAGLPGGTVEGITPGSWFQLQFNDGSTVTISGNSILTFSDHGQKKLYLKKGNVSANVKRQPVDKPMLIYTRSAMLEILGTRFEVEAGLAATTLNVSQGEVRVKRLSDNSTVIVPAKHRVVAAADREMLPILVPDSVSQWKSQLHLGPDDTRGKWHPRTNAQDARLETIPYTTPQGTTIYTSGFSVSLGDKPPVILQDDSSFRVRGRIALPRNVYFGVTVRRADGEFAGRFQSVRPAIEFRSGRDFEVTLQFRDFQLDPSLAEMENQLPSEPFDLIVETFWFHTLNERAGLEISEAELLSTANSALPHTSPPERPVIDIWTAASQGNLVAVRRHLAAGADINATVVAPGIPASGATPLHLAVLTDQREVAEFLIEKGADLGATAKDEHGGTPLHWAAALGRIGMAKRLIAARADVNAPDNNGYTPLDATGYAPQHEAKAKAEIAEFLREKGGRKRGEPKEEPALER